MTKAFTGVGDKGTTSLFDGTKVKKSYEDSNLLFLGKMDILNVKLGYLKCAIRSNKMLLESGEECVKFIEKLQNLNMDFMGYVQCPECINFNEPIIVEEIERYTREMWSELPPLKNFILPGESHEDCLAHDCRTHVRECELVFNDVWNEKLYGKVYMNRLSSYFFALARMINHILEKVDVKHIRT